MRIRLKLKNDTNRETAKLSALSSDKFEKYEYLIGKEIIPFNQGKMIERAFTYSPLGKAFEKQTKKKVDVFMSLNLSNKRDDLNQIKTTYPKYQMSDFIFYKLKKIR